MSDLTVSIELMLRSRLRYETARDYYDGTVTEKFGNRVLRRALRKILDVYRVNLAKTPVNAVADRLEIAAVTIPDNDALTEVLQADVWDQNDMLLEFPGTTRRTCEYGDSYLLVWPDPDDDSQVRISYNSPFESRMVYDPSDSRKKLYYVHVWEEGETRRADVFYDDRVEQWVQRKEDKPGEEIRWKEFIPENEFGDTEGTWPIENPYGEVPAFHFRTDRPWGTPLHLDAYGPQDAITKIIATHMGTVDYQGFPQRYALAEPDTDSDDDAGDDWLDDSMSNATTGASGNPGAGLRSGPAEVWWLKGVKGVGQFQVADPKAFLEPAEFYIRLMAQCTTTPLHYFDPSGDVPSGESLRTAEAPLLKKIRDLQQLLGSELSRTLAFAMRVLGYGDVKVDVRWVPPASSDDEASWSVAEAKIRAGVPVRQVLMEAGYTNGQVDGWIAEDETQDLTRRVALLSSIGDAVQRLGAGVGFGILTAEQVAAVIQGVLTEGGEDG